MHYGYRKKRLFSFPLLHYAPIPKCFDCFMLTFIVPIWDKQFQIFRGPLQTPFSWSNARSLKETCSKKSCVHNSRSARRICTKFSTRIRHGARRHPYYNFPLGANRVPNSGGSIFAFPWGPPLENWKIFCLWSRRKLPYGTRRRFWVRWWGLFSLKTGFGTKKQVFAINGQFDKLFRFGPNSVYGTNRMCWLRIRGLRLLEMVFGLWKPFLS